MKKLLILLISSASISASAEEIQISAGGKAVIGDNVISCERSNQKPICSIRRSDFGDKVLIYSDKYLIARYESIEQALHTLSKMRDAGACE